MLQVGVIGAGSISSEHLRFLRSSPLTQLVAICDRSLALAQFAARLDPPAQAYSSHIEMFQSHKLDVVHVLTSPQSHFELCLAALNAGAHVICEKPLVLSKQDLETLLTLARAKHLTIVENQNYRFNGATLWLQEMLARKTIGHLTRVDIRLALDLSTHESFADFQRPHAAHLLPGGIAHDFLPHLAYLSLAFAGKPQKLTTLWVPSEAPPLKHLRFEALLDGGPVTTRLCLSFNERPSAFTLSLYGTRGVLETDLFNPYRKVILTSTTEKLEPLFNLGSNGKNLLYSVFQNLWRKLRRRNAYEGLHVFLQKHYEALGQQQNSPISEQDIIDTHELLQSLLNPESQA